MYDVILFLDTRDTPQLQEFIKLYEGRETPPPSIITDKEAALQFINTTAFSGRKTLLVTSQPKDYLRLVTEKSMDMETQGNFFEPLKPKEAGLWIGLSDRRIRYYLKEGRLNAKKEGYDWAIPRVEIERLRLNRIDHPELWRDGPKIIILPNPQW